MTCAQSGLYDAVLHGGVLRWKGEVVSAKSIVKNDARAANCRMHAMHLKTIVAILCILGFATPTLANTVVTDGRIVAKVVPHPPTIEHTKLGQALNFDILLTNKEDVPYRLALITLKVYDHAGALESVRVFGENGHPPAIDIVGPRDLKAHESIDVFQPFTAFDSAVELHRLHYRLGFVRDGKRAPAILLDPDATVEFDVYPLNEHPAAYYLPMHDRVLVYDGHDYFSHHRRYNLVPRLRDEPATAVSANLYAYDFVKVGRDGEIVRGDPSVAKDWLSYAAKIYAPYGGQVVEAVDGIDENTFDKNLTAILPADAESKDPQGMGNHVVIKHADGRVSWLLHMKRGSVRVSKGQTVAAGQLVGEIGFSGDALFPHLHYTVTNSDNYPSQGVPSYFKNFVRLLGRRKIPQSEGQVDSGDIVQVDESHTAPPRRRK